MSKKGQIAIVIVNYNGKADTLACLRSLKTLEPGSWRLKVIVVDNGSTDGSVKVIEKTFPQITVLEAKQNLGFTGGNNLGIKAALKDGADYVLLLNNDTEVAKDFLRQLVKVAEKDKQIGITVPKIYFAKGFEYHKRRYKKNQQGKVIWYAGGQIDWQNMYGSHRGVDEVDQGQFDRVEETGFATGCCMLLKAKVLKEIGFLDDRLFLYLEDLDFSLKAKAAGYKIVYAYKARVWHKNAGSSGSGSGLHDYYMARNRLLIGFRYAPLRTKLALIKESLKRLVFGRKWEKIGIRDFYLGKLGKGSYAA